MSVWFLVVVLEVRLAWRFAKVAGSVTSTAALGLFVTIAATVRSDEMRSAILTFPPLRLTDVASLRTMRLAIRLFFVPILAVLSLMAAFGAINLLLVDAGMGVFGDSSFTAIREVLRVVAFGVDGFLAFTVGVRSVSVLTIGADFTIGAVRFLMVTVGADFVLVVTVGTGRFLTVTGGAERFLTVTVGTDEVDTVTRRGLGLETEVRDDLTCVLTEGALREVVLTVLLVAEVERGLERVLLAAVLAVVDLELEERVRVFLAGAERALAAGRALRVGGAFFSCRVSVLVRCDLAWRARDCLACAG